MLLRRFLQFTLLNTLGFLSISAGLLFAPPALSNQSLTILLTGSLSQTQLIQTIAQNYQQQQPQIIIEFIKGNSLSLFQNFNKQPADLIISHFPEGEAEFMQTGLGLYQAQLMYNKFIVLGPKKDPLDLASQHSIQAVLKRLAEHEVDFYAPSPYSGVHYRLAQLWNQAQIYPNWLGYEQTQQSGAGTLLAADSLDAYTFIDMGSYAIHKKKVKQIIPLFRDSHLLDNFYTATVVSQVHSKNQNTALAKDFFLYLASPKVQKFIQEFGQKTYGVELFTPYAHFDETIIQLQAEQTKQRQNIFFLLLGLVILIIGGLMLRAQQQKRIQLAIEQEALLDDLTQIGNRRACKRATQSLLNQQLPFAFILIDLCEFKAINDHYGHAAGDALLKHISQNIVQYLGSKGQVFRLGGDEFIVHLFDTLRISPSILNGLINAIEIPLERQQYTLHVSPSIGIAYMPEHSQNLEELFAFADQAMYFAKQNQLTHATFPSNHQSE